jgi:hypothetical protein
LDFYCWRFFPFRPKEIIRFVLDFSADGFLFCHLSVG